MIYFLTENLKHQEKFNNIDLEDYLEPCESPMIPLSYDLILSLICFDIPTGRCSIRCFRSSKYVSDNSLKDIISTLLPVSGYIL